MSKPTNLRIRKRFNELKAKYAQDMAMYKKDIADLSESQLVSALASLEAEDAAISTILNVDCYEEDEDILAHLMTTTLSVSRVIASALKVIYTSDKQAAANWAEHIFAEQLSQINELRKEEKDMT